MQSGKASEGIRILLAENPHFMQVMLGEYRLNGRTLLSLVEMKLLKIGSVYRSMSSAYVTRIWRWHPFRNVSAYQSATVDKENRVISKINSNNSV